MKDATVVEKSTKNINHVFTVSLTAFSSACSATFWSVCLATFYGRYPLLYILRLCVCLLAILVIVYLSWFSAIDARRRQDVVLY